MTTEFELKLEVPPAQAKGVRAQLARLRPKTEKLRAIYYDTPERLLQREGLALRLRCENGSWVQALKGDSGHALARLEHEVELGRVRDTPHPVAARHEGSPAGEKLVRVLGRGFDDSAWEAMFETDVERAKATVEVGASSVEIAFDRGRIVAGRRRLAISEIEFELKRGDAVAAVKLARQWCARHRLWLSTISKAQKGAQLAHAEGFGPAASAGETDFGKHASLRNIAGEALAVSLDQVIRNASELAAGSSDEEHIHQMRVGIRRTRTALRELVREDAAAEEQSLIHAFRELGKHRDTSHVIRTIAPRLREAGGPVVDESESDQGVSPARTVRAQPFQDAVLSLLAKSCELRADHSLASHAKATIVRRLAKLHGKVLADGCNFERIPADRQHRVRKRLKRLRYLAEFTAPLHDDDRLRAWLAKVKKVQDALGEYNDEMTALSHYREVAQTDSRALFAVGWLSADRQRVARECGRLLRKLAKTDPFWR